MRASDANKALVRRILSAYAEGDLAPLREVLDPGVVYHSHSPAEFFRFGGRHDGLASGVAALSSIASDYTIHSLMVSEVIGEGDVVWATTDVNYTERRSKVRMSIRVVSRWEVKKGRVIAVDEYFDTAEAALKQGRVVRAPSKKS